jgi:ribosomal protein S18 acetylase RimI-like enzyme
MDQSTQATPDAARPADDALRIGPAGTADAGEILTLQRAAYVTEAQLHGDPFLPALVESLDQVRKTISESLVLKATVGTRLAGAVRGRINDRTCLVGRLAVAPDLQGRGIGRALMHALEEEAAGLADACVLFTGHLSEANLRLYRRLGYAETHRERVADHLMLVHMRKPLVTARTPG